VDVNQYKSKQRNRLIAILCLLFVAGGVSAAVLYLKDHQLPKRLAVVESGVLYRSSQPDGRQLENVIDTYGIKTLLIVRDGSSNLAEDEIGRAKARGLRVVQIPVKSREPVPDEQVRGFFDVVDSPANRPILVHCSAGRHRTGYLCALYRIERMNWTVEQATNEMLSFGFDTKDHEAVLHQLKQHRPGAWKRTSPSGTSMSDVPSTSNKK
jgi:protein tyrosine/serine phosphatase